MLKLGKCRMAGRNPDTAYVQRNTQKAALQVGNVIDAYGNSANAFTIDDALNAYALFNRAARLAPKTQEFYRCQLSSFEAWCANHNLHQLADIGSQQIREYLVYLELRGLRDTSVHAAARAIRAFLNFCACEEYVSSSPMAKVAIPRLERRILPAFSHGEVRRLLDACTCQCDRAIVLFLLDTGCRAAEMTNLDGRDIDLEAGKVRIRQGKGRRDRAVFLGENTQTYLLAYYTERGNPVADEAVWISLTHHERLTPSGLHQLLKRLGSQAKVKHCAPHTFRRTYALWSLRNGMDIFRLARLMGHSDISVLRHYLYLLKDDLRAAHAQFGTVDRLMQE